MLLQINIESRNETDFIIASINDGIPKLFKISNWKVKEGGHFLDLR